MAPAPPNTSPASGEPVPEPQRLRYRPRGAVDLLLEQRRRVLVAAGAVLLVAVLYQVFAARSWRADGLLQLDLRGRSALGALEDAGPVAAPPGSPADTEIELIRSRAVLGEVIERLHLDVSAEPRHFPLVGAAFARWHGDDAGPAAAPPGLGGFSWGGDRVAIQKLEVPAAWVGKRLRLWAREGGKYELHTPEGDTLAGEVGKPLAQGELRLVVSGLQARPGTGFNVTKRSMSKLFDDLQRELSISEKGTGTGVIRVAAEASTPELAAALVNEVSRVYVRQDLERHSAEVQRTLGFVNGQLPELKANMDRAEAALNDYRASRGAAIDLSMETKAVLDRMASVEQSLSELELTRPELRERFTGDHPTVRALDAKAARLRTERAELERRFHALPETELKLAQLTRDAKVAGDLYVVLLQKAQELKVVLADHEGKARVVDAALVPDEPARPRPASSLGGGLLLGLALGIGLVLLRAALHAHVEDARTLEAAAELPVYATVPRSRAQARLTRAARKAGAGALPLLAAESPQEPAVEALRGLRTSLSFALAEGGGNVVAVTGAGPGDGKSFVCANLAQVLAEAGKRVLLVDADLRRGKLHAFFGAEPGPGLAEIVRGEQDAKAALRATGHPNLSLVTRGGRVPNPSELLASARFEAFVAWAARGWDVVLLDTAPVLAVTDATLAGRAAAVTLMVIRAGAHGVAEIEQAVRRAGEQGMKRRALVLNGVTPDAGAAGALRYRYD